VGVTHVTALERDRRTAAIGARHLDARHIVLAATSLVAVFAIALSLSGREAADEFASHAGGGSRPVNLNAVTKADDLLPLLATAIPDADRRRAAATQLSQFILSRRDSASMPSIRRVRRSHRASVVAWCGQQKVEPSFWRPSSVREASSSPSRSSAQRTSTGSSS
jgi:hypothetical protein